MVMKRTYGDKCHAVDCSIFSSKMFILVARARGVDNSAVSRQRVIADQDTLSFSS